MNSSAANNKSDKGTAAVVQQQSTITAILDKLDSVDDSKFSNRRQAVRHRYRRTDATIRAYHPGGSVAFSAVAMRNLSSTGAGFLYTGFLHIGTRVELTLPRPSGGDDLHEGKIIFCAHVTGPFHQIGVRFDHKISPKEYTEGVEKAVGAGVKSYTLGGNLLHLDNSEIDRKVMAHYLSTTKVALLSVTNEQDAIAAVKSKAFDLVMCAANLQGTFSDVVIGQLREAGYTGRVMAVTTSETPPERVLALQKAGVTDFLRKPYGQGKLLTLVRPFLPRVSAGTGGRSGLTAKQEMSALIERYMHSVKQLSSDIERATKENRIDRMEQICSSLSLAEAARAVMHSIDMNSSVDATNAEIKKLLNLCKSMIAPSNQSEDR